MHMKGHLDSKAHRLRQACLTACCVCSKYTQTGPQRIPGLMGHTAPHPLGPPEVAAVLSTELVGAATKAAHPNPLQIATKSPRNSH